MKGIILAGGSGTRLYPVTNVVSKQLLPVYDKPMIYYPLSTLMLAGIREIAIISTPDALPQYENLLGNGKPLGLKLSYFSQDKPRGLADAFRVCRDFINNSSVTLILGDNVFYGNFGIEKVVRDFKSGATIFGYPVKNPQRYGVIEFDSKGKVKSIIEKPSVPPSNFAVPGIYIYDQNVVEYSDSLSPSERGELEITDLNNVYLSNKCLNVHLIGRGIAWLDVGKCESLQEASSFIMSIEQRQSYKISCIEEISFRKGFIDFKQFCELTDKIPDSEYKSYLESLMGEFRIS